MNKDDKQRVIGKIVSINSDRFTIELLSGLESFHLNSYDEIHYFAQINSYVVIPYQNYYIIAEVISVKERDSIALSENAMEQILNKAKSLKNIDVYPIGTIKSEGGKSKFEFGVSVYPSLYCDVLYIKKYELDCIFEVDFSEIKINQDFIDSPELQIHGDNTRLRALSIGTSTIFEDYEIKIDIDKFFGNHAAILGNSGSGKSCTIASIIQNLFRKKSYSAIGSTFFILDVNGEYLKAFSEIHIKNEDISTKHYAIDGKDGEKFRLPHWFLNFEEWALLLNASEKTQLPILRNALGLATLFADENAEANDKIKNHILASCILVCFESSDSSVAKYQRIKSLVSKGKFAKEILNDYDPKYGSFSTITVQDKFLNNIKGHVDISGFEIPTYNNSYFSFNLLEECLDIAILFEEAHGNKQIRDYCSSLLTRFKSLRDREDYDFLKSNDNKLKIEEYCLGLIGLKDPQKEKEYIKERQIIILDLNSCEDEVVEIISCVVSRLIFERIKIAEPRNIFPVNLVLEEAHRYISFIQERNFLKANHIFERIAKEGRKYGMFLLISSQRPSEISRTVLSQCSNFIVHRIQNPEDLSHIRQITPHISETILKRMPSIPTQHALVFGQAVNLPATFKVNEANPLPKSDNNKVSKNWFRPQNDPIIISFDK